MAESEGNVLIAQLVTNHILMLFSSETEEQVGGSEEGQGLWWKRRRWSSQLQKVSKRGVLHDLAGHWYLWSWANTRVLNTE